jgi:hypothetical protein
MSVSSFLFSGPLSKRFVFAGSGVFHRVATTAPPRANVQRTTLLPW